MEALKLWAMETPLELWALHSCLQSSFNYFTPFFIFLFSSFDLHPIITFSTGILCFVTSFMKILEDFFLDLKTSPLIKLLSSVNFDARCLILMVFLKNLKNRLCF